MKIENISSSLLQVGMIFVLVAVSLYAFSASFLYPTYSKLVSSILPSSFPKPIYLTFFVLSVIGVIVSVGQTSTHSESSKARKFTGFLIMLSIPSSWAFSNHNWLELAGIYIDTSISFEEGLLIGGFLVLGHFFLDYIDSIKGWTSKLRDGGAPGSEVKDLHFKKSLFSILVVSVAFLTSTGIILGVILVRSSIARFVLSIPAERFVIGIGVPIIFSIFIIYMIREYFSK
ncbi:hypothetical protein AKJ52_01735 [candidate division MSBL1 archaeon SCGC-AAA382C18]|uniref:Uncharacterized protein n=1 Tax=candidate division MSBL1 archaeon SCGC-AAA382C18 TaxID=1698281 RepID=A0A133VJV6_9EURY|nr:hypothetical protein AKJ52_01735 [candidate division MSBL1 archaeon SCGC-AAA382C18]